MLFVIILAGLSSVSHAATATLTLSNTAIDQGQSVLFIATTSGSSYPYTYNYQIANAVTGSTIANQLYKNVQGTTNTFFWTPPYALYTSNTFKANVIITDALSATVNSIYSPMSYNGAPFVLLYGASNYILDTGQYVTLTTLESSGGTGSFNAIMSNITGAIPKPQGSPALITSIGGTNGVTMQVSSPTQSNTFTYDTILIDIGTTTPFSLYAYGTTQITVSSTPGTPALTQSNTVLDSGQLETLTAKNLGGGTGSYAVDFFNVTTGAGVLAQSIGYPQWLQQTPYPINSFTITGHWIDKLSCSAYSNTVTATNNIYCVGGYADCGSLCTKYPTNAVYYAPILSTGLLGPWTASANPYPTNTYLHSCIAYSNTVTATNNIYCVAGENALGITNAVYYAPILSSGLLGSSVPSIAANTYPTPTYGQSCVANANNIYCVAGDNTLGLTGAVYSAPIFSSGTMGSWAPSTNTYPTPTLGQSCVASANNIYCVAGDNSISYTNAVYSAPIFSSGTVGSWASSANTYPISLNDLSCIASASYIYCAGGYYGGSSSVAQAYYAPILSTGAVGPWRITTGTGYAAYYGSCVPYLSNIYCIFGQGFANTGSSYVTYGRLMGGTGISNTLNYTFPTNSPTSGNAFNFNVMIVDTGTTTPATSTPTTNGFIVNAAMAPVWLTSSNAIVNQAQYETLMYQISGGTSPYTYNFLITNTLNGNFIASQVFTGCTLTTNLTTLLMPWLEAYQNDDLGPETVTGTVIDNAPTPTSLVYTNTISAKTTPILVLNVTASNGTATNIITYGSNPVSINALVVGGKVPFLFKWTLNGLNTKNATSANVYSYNTLVLPAAGTYQYSVTAINSMNSVTIAMLSNTVIIVKNNTLAASSTGPTNAGYYTFAVEQFTGYPNNQQPVTMELLRERRAVCHKQHRNKLGGTGAAGKL